MESQQAKIPGLPSAKEEGKANFKLDTEKTFARLVITPIRAISDNGEERWVSIDKRIEIVPYPNPWGFGGMWGGGCYKPEEEEKVIAEFKRVLDPYAKDGLAVPEIQIIRQPEETRHVLTKAQTEEAHKRYTETVRSKAKGLARTPAKKTASQPPMF